MATSQPALTNLNPLHRRPIVEQATGDSRTTIYRKIKAFLFTKPVRIGGDRVAWPANEIEAINKARIAGKSDDEIRALVVKLEAARGGQPMKVCDAFLIGVTWMALVTIFGVYWINGGVL